MSNLVCSNSCFTVPCSMKTSATPRFIILFLKLFSTAKVFMMLPNPPLMTPSSTVIIILCSLKMLINFSSSKGFTQPIWKCEKSSFFSKFSIALETGVYWALKLFYELDTIGELSINCIYSIFLIKLFSYELLELFNLSLI